MNKSILSNTKKETNVNKMEKGTVSKLYLLKSFTKP